MTIAEQFDLTDRVVVITGGSRGLGLAMARGFAEVGATVVVASRKADACEQVAAELTATTGRPAAGIVCHVGRWDDCDHLIDATLERFGRLDVLINNAGMSPLYEDLLDVTEELYDKTFAVNLRGPFRLGVRAGAHMAGHDGGAIINVGTIGSLLAGPTELPYACAKAGLNALTVGLSQAYGPSVRVNSILPGAFATDITKGWTDEMLSGSGAPLGRIGQPEEVVAAALYFATPASSYTTGAILRIDGGYTRRVP